jgi:hypothetical protein
MNQQIKRVMELGKPESVVEKLVTQYLKDEAHKAWIASMQSEYDALYPEKWVQVEEITFDSLYDKMSTSLDDTYPSQGNKDAVQAELEKINYDIANNTETSNYTDYYCDVQSPEVSFSEWLNETNTIVVGSKELLDENGEPTGETEDITQDVPVRPEPEHVIDLQSWKDEHFKPYKKTVVRKKIRDFKDLEDDVTDLKKTVQFMARGFAGLWASLPQDVKDSNPYKDNFDLFAQAVATTEMRLDLEADQTAKIAKILQDEATIAQILVDTGYVPEGAN